MNTIEDYRVKAKGTFDPLVERYINGGSGSQHEQNAQAFNNYLIRPYRVADTSRINISTTILGHHVSVPICIAPMGLQHKVSYKAEHITATAAHKSGIGFAMSAWASTKMEDLVTNSQTGLKFLNIYIYKKRWWTEHLVKKAEENGFHGFVVGFARGNPAARKTDYTGWTRYVNLEGLTEAADPTDPDYPIGDPSATWADVTWLKSITKLPVIVKGMLSARDAIQAVHAGADAIIVSNHGGRQLPCVSAPVDVLPEIVAAVGKRCEVYMDGGVRSGLDVFKALALGAKAVFIGRPVLWGMECGEVEGVVDVIDIYKRELINTMNLSGVADVHGMPGDVIVRREMVARL